MSNKNFADRHIGLPADDIQKMLDTLQVSSLDNLCDDIIPSHIFDPMNDQQWQYPALDEYNMLNKLKSWADMNHICSSMIGLGYHGCKTPAVILRNILENPGWYTAYTPYQPEIAQGRLEALLNYQQMIRDLTGLDIANASLLDEATAAGEAMSMMNQIKSRAKKSTLLLDANCHQQVIDVVQTRAHQIGVNVVLWDYRKDKMPSDDVFGIILNYHASDGGLCDIANIMPAVQENEMASCVIADPLALTLHKKPADLGFDIAIGSTQRLGMPMGYGGPHAAYMACKDDYKRYMPGRIIAVSKDKHERPAYRMALQVREQHIRRDKASSNLCTSQALPAMVAGFYGLWHGNDGLIAIADKIHRLAVTLAKQCDATHHNIFDCVTIKCQNKAKELQQKLHDAGYWIRVIDDDHIAISIDETHELADINVVLKHLGKSPATSLEPSHIAHDYRRQDKALAHDVFERYHSETEMMRYMRYLMDRDLALDRAMIPLGSCTMKLNAASEMMPISWSQFGNIHPFAPISDAKGYQHLIDELHDMLCVITGFDHVSFQPNSGAQGEYAGLLSIKQYHESQGQGHRNICLIPTSAHGTNPASAVMCGFTVKTVKCDDDGNIDIADLQRLVGEHQGNIAALMMTYPSTHGVFEEKVSDICAMVHDAGGQIYMDGANLNAMVGLCRPGKFGADVSHMNLHKTFCIPHGGGGPGMGPIGVRAHLQPFLPNHWHDVFANEQAHQGHCVTATNYGSALILIISWAYITMMGRNGLQHATKTALLSANYIATRLKEYYPILYTGKNGYIAHEVIIDLKKIKEDYHISNEDIAKRLIDYGFHAPTMSFPVVDTLMIEPTESESLYEVNRFCDAMIAIYHEIKKVGNGEYKADDNPLINAPHSWRDLVNDNWQHSYPLQIGLFPEKNYQRRDKYFPPVSRVDNVWGDRNLFCACLPISEYEE